LQEQVLVVCLLVQTLAVAVEELEVFAQVLYLYQQATYHL
jgi:hypothetical protein